MVMTYSGPTEKAKNSYLAEFDMWTRGVRLLLVSRVTERYSGPEAWLDDLRDIVGL